MTDTQPSSNSDASEAAPAPEKFVGEADLRHTTDVEIARMKAFGIGMDADGSDSAVDAEAPSGLAVAGLSPSVDAQ